MTDPWLSRYGISQRYHPNEDIRGMTLERAAEIFTGQYWPARADELPAYLAIPLMSFSVVEGPEQAVRALEASLGVTVDKGVIGDQTIHAASTTLGQRDKFLVAFFRACRKRFAESPRWLLDGEGWESRQVAASLAAKIWAPMFQG